MIKYISSEITLELQQDICVGCGLCETVCPHRVFKVKNKKAEILRKEQCMECGACASNCPVHAIDLEAGVGCAIAILASKSKKKWFKWM